MLSKQKYSHSADVYGFGVCLWEMISRKIPYQGLSPYQAAFAILKVGEGGGEGEEEGGE